MKKTKTAFVYMISDYWEEEAATPIALDSSALSGVTNNIVL
jgi:hypothetical protein